jgi:hypothetical protein
MTVGGSAGCGGAASSSTLPAPRASAARCGHAVGTPAYVRDIGMVSTAFSCASPLC